MNKLGGRFWTALVIFSLVGQIAWVVENMYLNVFIYEMFNASASDISLMVALSAVTATLTTVVIGALSDKLGKRKIFICGGYIAWGISILAFGLVRIDFLSNIVPYAYAGSLGISLTIILDCVMTFFGSSANDACFNAWLTDSVDEGRRGKAEGVNAMMPLVALLAVFGSFMAFDLSQASSWTTIFIIIGVVVTVIGVVGLFIVKDAPVNTEENGRYFANIIYGFRPSVVKKNKDLYFSLIAFALFGIAIQIFMPYLIIYYTETLKLDNYVLILAPAVILASALTVFYGRLYDKFGYINSLIPSLCALGLGFIIMFIFSDVVMVFIGSLLIMSGYLTGTAVFGARIRDNTPPNKSGMFQGLRIVGQVLIPGIIGPFIGSAVLAGAQTITNNDGTTSFLPNTNIFLAGFITLAILAVYIAILIIINKKRNSTKNSDTNENE